MLIPLKTVTDSYASLYGKDAVPQLKSIGEPDTFMYYEYDAENQTYRVPFSVSNSAYTPVLDTLKKKGDRYSLRIGYVSAENIGIDEKGNLVDPTPDQADFFQIFHVQNLYQSMGTTSDIVFHHLHSGVPKPLPYQSRIGFH